MVFDSSVDPPVRLERYLARLKVTFRCSDAAFIASLMVVDRVLCCDGERRPLTNRNVHRLFLASLMITVKYYEDFVYSNSHYAKAGGVQLREVNRLERVMLTLVDFDVRVKPELYWHYEAALLAWSANHSQKSMPYRPHLAPPAKAQVQESAQAPDRVLVSGADQVNREQRSGTKIVP